MSMACFKRAAGWLQLLNAKPENVERESETVAQSGRSGAVTIATNMAGRGTDIILGGNPEFMARLKLREMLMPRVVSQIEGENVLSRSSATKVWLLAPQVYVTSWGCFHLATYAKA